MIVSILNEAITMNIIFLSMMMMIIYIIYRFQLVSFRKEKKH